MVKYIQRLIQRPTLVVVVTLLLLVLSTTLTYHYTHTTVPLTSVPNAYAQNLLSERDIFNKVFNLAANRLQTDAWAQPAQPFLTVEEILNKVYDTAGQFLRTSAGGGGTSQAWPDITSGTNTNTLTMGTGGTMTTSGTGIINANQFKGSTTIPIADGGTGISSPLDDNVMVGNGTVWQLKALPNCIDSGGQHLNYTVATNTWSCGTTGDGTGASAAFNALTSGTNTTAAMVVGSGATLTPTGTGVINATQFKGNVTVPTADGGTGVTAAVDDNLLMGNGTIWQSKAVPTCTDVTGNHLNYDAATNTWSCGTTSSAGAPAFNTVTSGTNTTAAMVVGTGGSLTTSGTGTNNANQFKGNAVVATVDGGTGVTAATDDTVLLGNGTIWQNKAVPSCTDSAGNHLNYDPASNTFSCGTSSSSANTAFNVLTSGTNTTATMVVGTGASLAPSGTGTINASQFKGNTVVPVADGGTGVTTATDDNMLMGNGTIWQSKAVPTCTDVTGNHLNYDASTNTFSCGTTSSSGAPTFNAIGSGTNTTAALVVGTGSSLTVSGSGTINATQFKGNTTVPTADGGTGLTAAADDNVLVGNGTLWQSKTIPTCADTSGNHLNYDATTNSITCGTSTSGASPSFSGITTGTNTTATMTLGTGSTLTTSGSGVNNANQFKGNTAVAVADGGTGLSSAVDDNVMVGNGTVWQGKVLPNCTDTAGQHVNYTAATNTFSCGTSSVAPSTVAFDTIATGTNTTATMTVGSGSTITFVPSGVVNANQFNGNTIIQPNNGGTGLTVTPDDNVMVGNGSAWQAKALPDCDDTLGQHLNYDTTTNVFTCGTSGAGGGGGSFSALSSGTNTTAAMVVGTGASLDVSGTGTNKATHLGGALPSAYATIAGVQTLDNTFVKPLIVTQTITANAFAINIATTRIAVVPALSAGVTVSAPTTSGSFPYDGQDITIVFLPSTAPQSITWNAIWSARGGMALPTSVIGDNDTISWVKFAYVASITKYVMVGTTIGVEPGITSLATSTTYTCPHLTSRACKMIMTGTAGTVTIAIPSGGTPVDGKQLVLRIKCTNLQSLALTTGAGGFIDSPNVPITGLTCPAAGASWTALGVEYSSDLDRWQLYATN